METLDSDICLFFTLSRQYHLLQPQFTLQYNGESGLSRSYGRGGNVYKVPSIISINEYKFKTLTFI